MSHRTARPAEDQLLGRLILSRAREHPDSPFLHEVGGASQTSQEFCDRSLRVAAALRRLGVVPGDRIVSMLPNSADSVVLFGACALGGFIHVPINISYVGHMLEHALDVARPSVLVIGDEQASRLDDITVPEMKVVVRGDAGIETLAWGDLLAETPLGEDETHPGSWEEVATLLFTSGTTGPSKAVMVPWLHLLQSSLGIWQGESLDSTAVIYSPWPINHISGSGAVYLALLRDGQLVVRERWSTSEFLRDVIEHECTVTTLMAEMTGYFAAMDGLEDTALTHIFLAPVTRQVTDTIAAFGGVYCTNYNSTETNSPIGSRGYEPVPLGSAGYMREGVEWRLVDEDGKDVGPGEPGELLVRTTDKYAMNLGYWGMPDATAKAWDGGWFHTGDLMRVDADGCFFLVGRLKDRIRVRGENVSADELEMIINTSPIVKTSAAVGRPTGGGEDEIVLFVVPARAGALDVEGLRQFCESSLPKFMRPAEIRSVDTLPMTPTGKIQRAVLRDGLAAEVSA